MVKKIASNTFVYLILLLMYVPILVLIVFSFTDSDNVGVWNGFTMDLYPRLFSNDEIMISVGNTLIIAIVSSFVSTLLGTLGAIGVFYCKKRSRAVIETINQIPVVNAEIVIALSLTFTFVFLGNYIFRNDLFSFWTILIGHVTISLPFVYLNVKPKLQQMDPSLYEAAINLGCTPRQALTKVVFPQIQSGVLSGFILAFTLSLDDFIVTAFLTGPGLLSGAGKIQTISTYIQSVIKKKVIPNELRALAMIIFTLVLLATLLTVLYNRSQSKEFKALIKFGKNKTRSILLHGAMIIIFVVLISSIIFLIFAGVTGGN